MLELKKSIRALRKSLKFLLIFLGAIVCMILIMSQVMQNAQILALVDVGIVISPEDETETSLVTQYISSMGSVRSICRFRYLDEEEALEQLEEGSLQAVIVFPDSFYDDVDSGKNTPAILYLSENGGLNVEIFRELLGDGVSFLQTAEAGVYAMLGAAKDADLAVKYGRVGDLVATEYILAALGRGVLYKQTICLPIGDVNYYQYYFTSGMLIFLLLMGISFGSLYRRQAKVVEQKLRIYGLGCWKLTAVKIAVMAIPLWIAAVIWYAGGCCATAYLDTAFLYWDRSVIWQLLILGGVIACFFHLIYGLSGQNSSNAIILLAVLAVMILCSGLVVPSSYLPMAVQTAGSVLPLTFWQTFSLDVLFAEAVAADYIRIAAWAGISVLAGGVALWKNG
ncbi:MAG: ABC transporter permease [Lachnospiraceae bacterium]|nr:ABC transporter permease [Lachnospiraceae bacterium]